MFQTIIRTALLGARKPTEYGAVGWNASPYLTFFIKRGGQIIELADPATMPAASVTDISWSRFGNFVAVLSGSNVVSVYTLSNDTVTLVWTGDFSGGAPDRGGNITHIAWTKERDNTGSDNWLSLFFPNGQFYNTDSKSVSSPGSAFNDYSLSGLGNIICADFLLGYNSSDGAAVIARSVGAEYLFCVELGGFGSSVLAGRIVTQPSVAPLYVASRRDGTAFAVVLNDTSDNVLIYTRSGANWDIAHTLTVGGTPVRCCFSDDGNYLAVVHDTSPYYDMIDFTGGTPVVASADDALPAAGTDVAMSRDGRSFLVTTQSAPYLELYARQDNGEFRLANVPNFGFSKSAALCVALKNNAYS